MRHDIVISEGRVYIDGKEVPVERPEAVQIDSEGYVRDREGRILARVLTEDEKHASD